MNWLVKYTQVLRGRDGELSIRRLFSLFFAFGMIRYQERAFSLGKEIEGDIIFQYGLLILGILGIVTLDNTFSSRKQKTENDSSN